MKPIISTSILSVPALIFCVSCSQIGPSNDFLKSEIANTIPEHWELVRLEVQDTENLGSNVNPLIQSRFKATLQLKEDIFNFMGSIPDLDEKFQSEVTYVQAVESKGANREIYGLSTSTQHMDSWSVELEFDDFEIFQLGDPLAVYSPKPIIHGTPEAEDFIAKARDQMLQEQQSIKSILKNGKDLSVEKHGKYGTDWISFKLTSFDDSQDAFEGEFSKRMGWHTSVTKVSGYISGATVYIVGFGDFNVRHTEYKLNLFDENSLSGSWELVSQSAILWGGHQSGSIKIASSSQ